MKKGFVARRLFEFDIGRYFGVSLLQFFCILAIFLKTYFTVNWLILGILFLSTLFIIWIIGFLIVSTEFYLSLQKRDPMNEKILNELKKIREGK